MGALVWSGGTTGAVHGGELSRGLHTEAAVGAHPVVFPPPVTDDHPALAEGVEQLPGEALAPAVAAFPSSEVPDLFTINRRFNWKKPHGQWMNQMLKDIDAAAESGDTDSYEALTARYSAWAEQYLRR